MSRLYFEFKFDFEEDETSQTLRFEMTLPEGIDHEDFWYGRGNASVLYETVFSDFDTLEEKYGIHDVDGSANDGEFAVGFCTYEVPKDKTMELMLLWKKKVDDCGITTGDIIEVAE